MLLRRLVEIDRQQVERSQIKKHDWDIELNHDFQSKMIQEAIRLLSLIKEESSRSI